MTSRSATVTEFARAKINLALHVVARRDDGYHVLDSLVAFAGIGDELTVEVARETDLHIEGPFAGQLAGTGPNIISAAATALVDAWPDRFQPVAIRLVKNLPVASGIGGGSADAAAVIRAMLKLFGPVGDAEGLAGIALRLGADVPVCFGSTASRMRGIGDEVAALPNLPALPAVLVNPGIAVSTPPVFAKLGIEPGASVNAALDEPPESQTLNDWCAWLASCRNDLQAPASTLVPEIEPVLDAISQAPGHLLSRMSGSGATCFGVFQNQPAARTAATAIAAANPGWWVRDTTIS